MGAVPDHRVIKIHYVGAEFSLLEASQPAVPTPGGAAATERQRLPVYGPPSAICPFGTAQIGRTSMEMSTPCGRQRDQRCANRGVTRGACDFRSRSGERGRDVSYVP